MILPRLKQVWLVQKPVLQCKYGETAICRWRYSSEQINSKRHMARKDRFLVALGVEYTLTDGSVEQYPRLQQSTLTYRCHSGFCPPQKVSPRTQSASGFCPGGYNPLADSVRGDTIRQRILSGETCSASGFCPSSAECVPPPPPPLQQLIQCI